MYIIIIIVIIIIIITIFIIVLQHINHCIYIISPRRPHFKNTRMIARNHYSQIPHMKVLYPGVKSAHHGPSWAIMGHHGLFLTTDYNIWFLDHYRLQMRERLNRRAPTFVHATHYIT